MGEVVVVSSEEEMEMDVVMETGEGKLLPRMVLRVLLVESDDSTRQIIAALLRKCSYRVAAVSDGLKAWEILKRGPHNIDLILTEVELPSISGFALLTLVMEHEICKKIPVIMMSSHDSIGVVFKCMLKGAADFLIKPIRKNELKNLWQHVWRRHSNLVAAQHKVEAASENNAASNQSCDFVASAQKNKECSEKGSDTQSSCTTPCLEAESAYVQNMQGRLLLKSKDASNSCDTDKMKQEECTQSDEETFMPDSESEGKSIKVESEGTLCKRKFKSNAFRNEEDGPAAKMMRWDEGVRSESHREKATITSENHSPNDELVGPSRAAIDLIGTFDNCPPKGVSGQSTLGDGANNLSFAPHLELSLRRYSPSDSKTQETVEGHNLNHSNSSAFSRYNGSKTLQSLFPASSGDCAESKKGTSDSYKEFSNEILENTVTNSQWHDAASNNSRENMTALFIGPSGQVEAPFPSLQPGLIPAPGVSFDSLGAGYDHRFPPFYLQTGAPSVWIPKPVGQQEQSPVQMSSSHCSEIQNLEQSSPTDQIEDEQDKNLESEDLRNGSLVTGPSNSSSLCSGVVDHINNIEPGKTWNRNDCTVSGSVTKTTDSEGVNDEGHLVHDGFNGMDSHRSIQREAALTKFRLKRKGRCFEKKVRYQSRKRLAEQRPRVKGQFVRQAQCETP